MLVGRAAEQSVLTEVLEAVRNGRSAVLTVTGDAGIGKTALLDWAVSQASGTDVVCLTGVEHEMDLGLSGLLPVLHALEPYLSELPAPQQRALNVVLALEDGPPPSEFAICISTFTLITTAAARRPVVLVADDAQWLDATTRRCLAFAARRSFADAVAYLFGVRGSAIDTEFAAFPVLGVNRLSERDTLGLLAALLPSGQNLDFSMAQRVAQEADGNPLAVQQLASQIADGSLSSVAPAQPLPLDRRLEKGFLKLVDAVTPAGRMFLLLAASMADGGPAALFDAAKRLELPADGIDSALAPDLVTIGATVQFRHPLVRSAIYTAAAPVERRRAHSALADAYTGTPYGDLRAWHRGMAAVAPDATVADELEAAGNGARARGGSAAAAWFLGRAADLTSDPPRRGGRLLLASKAAHAAGSRAAARQLLARAEADISDGDGVAVCRWGAGLYRAEEGRFLDAASEIYAAALAFRDKDAGLCRRALVDALSAGLDGGGVAAPIVAKIAATAAGLPPSGAGPPQTTDLLLDGVATWVLQGRAAAVPLLRELATTWRPPAPEVSASFGWVLLGFNAMIELWDFEAARAWLQRAERHAREHSLLPLLRPTLRGLTILSQLAGDGARAAALTAEARELIALGGGSPFSDTLVTIDDAALRGDSDTVLAGAAELRGAAEAQGFDRAARVADAALSRLQLARGEYREVAELEVDPPGHYAFGLDSLLYVDVVEAATRSGRLELARRAADRAIERAGPSAPAWARGLGERCAALLAPALSAEDHYQESLRHLSVSGAALDQARSALLYGEWLRREGRRAEAREQLRGAHDALISMGATAFASRAAVELLAAGEGTARRPPRGEKELTAREVQVADLAVQGATKAEMAAQLYVSVNTVDYHLRNVYRKLGVSTRRQLVRAYRSQDRGGLPPPS
jgi:DNA-binding CsgD family transcriptional regulator